MENERDFDCYETHGAEVNEQYHVLTAIDCNVEQDRWRPIKDWSEFAVESAAWELNDVETTGTLRAQEAYLRNEDVYWYDANEGTVFAVLESLRWRWGSEPRTKGKIEGFCARWTPSDPRQAEEFASNLTDLLSAVNLEAGIRVLERAIKAAA